MKTVLVTGAARGIGKATARVLGARGWRVAVLDRNAAEGRAAAAELGATFFECDVASEPSVEACVRAASTSLGGVAALVNNAGIAGAASVPVDKLPLEEWNRRIGTNLTGAFLMAKHCAALLRQARGAMVNIASTRALQSEPNTEAYSASKGGVVALTHALAISLGPDVRVNCISPGWIATDEWQRSGKRHPPKLSAKDHEQHPAGRVGKPEDIASLARFLLSPDAGFITGAHFVVDGGMTRKMIYV